MLSQFWAELQKISASPTVINEISTYRHSIHGISHPSKHGFEGAC
jgi:hypothetical protein